MAASAKWHVGATPNRAGQAAARRQDVSGELLESLRQAVDIVSGTRQPARLHPAPDAVDVRAIRRKLGLSQPGFASRFGFALATVRDWEQGRRRPEQAARTLLLVIARNPAAVTEALENVEAPPLVAAR